MPLSSSITVTWPTAKATTQKPASVVIRQREFQHDVVVLTYYVEPHAVQRYKAGTPIRIRWGYIPRDTTEFFGTVLFARPHAENEKHSLRVVCVGTSYPLKDVSPTANVGVSVEHVVGQMAAKARLDLVRDATTETWPMLVRTAKETGWQYLVRLAKRQGYTLFVNTVTMHFYDPVRMLLANKNSWPVLKYHYGRGNDFSGDIIKFTPLLGDQGVPGQDQRSTRIMSVDPVSGKVIGADDSGMMTSLATLTATPDFGEFLTGQPAHSPAEARAYVEGHRRATRWVHRATAQVYGNVRLRQGYGVYISGVSKESDGLWYVSEADHEMTAENHPQQYRYFTNLTLLRDSREVAAIRMDHRRPLRNEALHIATPVLSNGHWVSTHQIERVNAA